MRVLHGRLRLAQPHEDGLNSLGLRGKSLLPGRRRMRRRRLRCSVCLLLLRLTLEHLGHELCAHRLDVELPHPAVLVLRGGELGAWPPVDEGANLNVAAEARIQSLLGRIHSSGDVLLLDEGPEDLGQLIRLECWRAARHLVYYECEQLPLAERTPVL